MKAVIIGALAATAFAEAPTYVYPGTYKATASGTDCCDPDGDVVVSATSGQIKATWSFGTTNCGGTSGAIVTGEDVTTALVNTPSSGDVTWSPTVQTLTGDVVMEVPTNANGDFNLNLDGLMGAGTAGTCSFALEKKPSGTVTFPGVYSVTKKLGTEASCCYPSGDVVLRTVNTNDVQVDFEFGTCNAATTAFSNDVVSGSNTPDSDTKEVSITANTDTYVVKAAPVVDATLLLDLSAVGTDCAATLTKKSLPTTLTYNKVFEVETESSATGCCYPDGLITATQDSTTKKVKLGWTFESDCTDTATKGKTVSVEGTIDSVTNDVTIDDSTNTGNSYTLVAPQTATGAWSLDLSDIATGCSAVLDTKSGYVLGLGSLVALSLSYVMF